MRAHHAATSLKASALGLGAACGVALAIACGANDIEAPVPPQTAAQQESVQCRSFDDLMPRFNAALEGGGTEGLRTVIRDRLLDGDPPPMNDVLRSVFQTMARFAAQPPEAGAPAGEVCADPPPPVQVAHPLCEMRRAMFTLVHEGKGLDALALVDPLLGAVFDYILGRQPAATQPHYEVAHAVSRMCRQNANCQMNDTLDLVIAFTAFMETNDGRVMLDRLDAMVKNPALEPFLKDDGAQYGGENGIVALVEVVMTSVQGMDDPSDLDALPIDQLPAEIRPDAQAALEDVKKMLDPAREPNILRPLKRGLNCMKTADQNRELIRMVYRLGLESDVPEFGLTTIMGAVKGLRETDERGTLVHLAQTLAKAIRADEQAVDSAAKVCATLFSTEIEPGQTRSPAELALPDVANLFRDGVAGEAMCAVDTMVYGCAGGAQPACER